MSSTLISFSFFIFFFGFGCLENKGNENKTFNVFLEFMIEAVGHQTNENRRDEKKNIYGIFVDILCG